MSNQVRAASTTGRTADRLADSVIFLLAMTIVQRLFGFLRGMLFCRWLEPADLGQWDMALGFIELAAPLLMLGLPGSFGRFVEHYRERGQLKVFLRRTTGVTAIAVFGGIAAMLVLRESLSQAVFGTTGKSHLVVALAFGLVTVTVYNFASTLLTAFRRSRVVSGLEFLNSLLFASAAIGLLAFWQTSAVSIVVAYAIACMATATVSLLRLREIWRELPAIEVELTHRGLWARLFPFALWVWGTNWLANMFEQVDRYMIIHAGNFSAEQALAAVGNYHSSRVLPLLLVSVTGLLGTMLTPYLSHDWELGGRLAVSRRMNMTLKLLSICLMLGATAILLTAPLLFASAFRGKFQSGLAVLPWTLTYCVWFGIARVAQKYLWCAERVGLAAMAWLAGLLLNVGLNFLLLPRFGLSGVVWSTAAGNLTSLLFLYGINRALGMRFERATWVLSAAPLLLAFGPWAACCGCGLILLSAAATPWLFHSSEKQQLLDVGRDYQFRLRAWFGGRSRRKEFSGT